MSDIKIVDWPKRPAEQRRDELEIENAELRKLVDLLTSALRGAKIEHMVVDEDCYYSCPASGHCCRGLDICTCGADEHNAKIDAALKAAERGGKV